MREKREFYVKLLGVAVVSFFIFYGPFFLYLSKIGLGAEASPFSFSFNRFLVTSPLIYGQKLGQIVFFGENLTPVYIIIGIFLTFLYLRFQKDRLKKGAIILMIGACLQFILLASIVNASFWQYYLTPIVPIFFLILAEVLLTILAGKRFLLVKVVLFTGLIYLLTDKVSYIAQMRPLEKYGKISKSVSLMEEKEKEKSFRVLAYAPYSESYPTADLPWTILLEKRLGKKMVRVVDEGNSYKFIGTPEYFFLVCQSYPNTVTVLPECLEFFERDGYIVEELIYESDLFSVYAARGQRPQSAEIKEILTTKDLGKQGKLYRQLIERVGPVEAQEELNRSGLPFDGQSHLLNHYVGDWLYEKYGPEGLSFCREYFLSSCYHGFVIHAVEDSGYEGLTKVMDMCWKKGPHIAVQCSHAIGHGLLAWIGYKDLTGALGACDEVGGRAKNFPIYNCYDGVFMENIWAVHETGKASKDQWLSSDPIYPCNDPRIESKYIQACWSNQPMRLYQMFYGDVRLVGEECAKISNLVNQSTCFDGLARQIHPESKGSVERVFQMCGQLPQGWVDSCVISIAKAEYSVGGVEIPFVLCRRLSGGAYESCHETLINIIYDYTLADQKLRQEHCGKIEDPGFKKKCLEYKR